MNTKKFKRGFLLVAIAALIGGGAIYKVSLAAEDEHGHPHAHEKGEEEHK